MAKAADNKASTAETATGDKASVAKALGQDQTEADVGAGRVKTFGVLSTVRLNGKTYEAKPGAKIPLTRALFDQLKPTGAIDGEWPAT